MDFKLRKEHVQTHFYIPNKEYKYIVAHIFFLTCDKYSNLLMPKLFSLFNILHHLSGKHIKIYAPHLSIGYNNNIEKTLQQGFYYDIHKKKNRNINEAIIKEFYNDYLFFSSNIAENLSCTEKLPCIIITNNLKEIKNAIVYSLNGIDDYKIILDEVIKIVSFLKSHILKSDDYSNWIKDEKEKETIYDAIKELEKTHKYLINTANINYLKAEISSLEMKIKKKEKALIFNRKERDLFMIRKSKVEMEEKISTYKEDLIRLNNTIEQDKHSFYQEKKEYENKLTAKNWHDKPDIINIFKKYQTRSLGKKILNFCPIVYKEIKDLFFRYYY